MKKIPSVKSELHVKASEELEAEVRAELEKAKANKLTEQDITYLLEVERAKRSNRKTST